MVEREGWFFVGTLGLGMAIVVMGWSSGEEVCATSMKRVVRLEWFSFVETNDGERGVVGWFRMMREG